MTKLDELWYEVEVAHRLGKRVTDDGRWQIDLSQPPSLGPARKRHEAWSRYIAALMTLVQKAAQGREGLKLEYNRFLSRRAP